VPVINRSCPLCIQSLYRLSYLEVVEYICIPRQDFITFHAGIRLKLVIYCRYKSAVENPFGRHFHSKGKGKVARFKTFTAVIFQVEVFWFVTPCSVVVGHQRWVKVKLSLCLTKHPTMKMYAMLN
jgi:hypothetical protein